MAALEKARTGLVLFLDASKVKARAVADIFMFCIFRIDKIINEATDARGNKTEFSQKYSALSHDDDVVACGWRHRRQSSGVGVILLEVGSSWIFFDSTLCVPNFDRGKVGICP